MSTPSPIDDEIDLLQLAKTLWNGRRTVIKSVIIFGVIGFLIAITSPKEYEATTIMVPSGSSGREDFTNRRSAKLINTNFTNATSHIRLKGNIFF